MKKIYSFRNLCKISVAGLVFLTFACQKPDEVQTFDDIFDISGIMELNQKIDTARDLATLSALVNDAKLNVAEDLTAEKVEKMYTVLEEAIQLSMSEKERLLRNDPEALMQVLTRFGNLPPEFGDKNAKFDDLKNSPINRYLLVQNGVPGINYYPEDYYSAIQAYRRYVENCIIWPLKKIHIILLHDQSELPKKAHLMFYILITRNNKWDMWWSYWWYGCKIYRIKHKGGSGSFPG